MTCIGKQEPPSAVYFNGLLDNVVSFANMNNFTNAMAQESG
jgi:hypothetical protein